MDSILQAIRSRRAVKAFESARIPDSAREQILEATRSAPSSFNMQPYKLYWIESEPVRTTVARLCLGQRPAVTASALAAFVADIGSMKATAVAQADWMRTNNFATAEVRDFERKAKLGRVIFAPGPFGLFGLAKRVLLGCLNLFKVLGMPPLSRSEVFKWATKGTALACQNFMIAAEAIGFNTCPMEGFDRRRLSRLLKLSGRHQEIVMVIAIGRRSRDYTDRPQWRRPLSSTVTFL